MRELTLSVKLNLLAIGVILAVGLAISAAAVLTIDRLTGSLGERLMQAEVRSMLDGLADSQSVLFDSGVGEVPSYIRAAQKEFLDRVADYRLGQEGRVFVLADDGRTVHRPRDRSADPFAAADLRRILVAPSGMFEAEVDGRPTLVAMGAFRPWGWHLVITWPVAEVNAKRNEFLATVWIILGGCVLVGSAMFAWMAGRFVRPIRSLSDQMAALTEDNLGAQLQFRSAGREVSELQRSFELMRRRLHAATIETKRAEEEAWRQANYDSLTELPNRRMFQERLDSAVKASARSGRPFALLFLDLDQFKDVNDTLGHDQGDLLLVESARRLSRCIRQTDTLARLGGDEFTILLVETDEQSAIERVARAILQELAQPFTLLERPVYVSASIGITLYPTDADSGEALLRNADQAMYMAKADGRNCFRYFTRWLQERAVLRMQLLSDLRHAVDTGQFTLHYQPIVDLRSGEIHKAEALIRWNHPTRGLVSPAEFIEVAEETGLIHSIGDWVFRQAAQQVARWRATIDPRFKISVNTSPLQFAVERNSTLDWMAHLASLSLPGDAVIMEITEGILMHSDRDVTKRLSVLRESGLQIALDDFGTGYSSLSYLRKFQIDFLKIDRSFVSHLDTDGSDRALCEAIVVMAHKLGIRVIAEGIETRHQELTLAKVGCDFGQGYVFSKPVTAAELEHVIVAANAKAKAL